MGLVDNDAAATLLADYIDHVVHFIRKERRSNPITGKTEAIDTSLMHDVENKLSVPREAAETFRESLVHRVAAWRMDNPDAELDYSVIFGDILQGLNDAFYDEKRQFADRLKANLLTYLTVEDCPLTEDEQRKPRVPLNASIKNSAIHESALLKWSAVC